MNEKKDTKSNEKVVSEEAILKVCCNCMFGEQVSDLIKCRRFPPTSDGKGDVSIDTQPLLRPDDWCGEFKGK